jgi:uncharacterized protein
MKTHFKTALLAILVLIVNANNVSMAQALTDKPQPNSSYMRDIKKWHSNRIESLKSENGWLNLAGLFWLEEGKNTFGSDTSNKIVFPKGEAFLGELLLNNGGVFIMPKAPIMANNQPMAATKVFPTDTPIVMQSGFLKWFVIKRGHKYGIRLRDLQSPHIKHFTGVKTYPITQKWRIKATLEPAEAGKKIAITDVLGQTNLQSSPGALVFTINNTIYRLDAVDEGESLFILFKDKTNGEATYGAGRFLYANKPDANGETYLDFNKAINPPCAFTDFATCPLAPKQNWLPIAIPAGEKNYGQH